MLLLLSQSVECKHERSSPRSRSECAIASHGLWGGGQNKSHKTINLVYMCNKTAPVTHPNIPHFPGMLGLLTSDIFLQQSCVRPNFPRLDVCMSSCTHWLHRRSQSIFIIAVFCLKCRRTKFQALSAQ